MIMLKSARIADTVSIMNILASGRRAQRLQGFTQWEDGYPDEDTVRRDITAGAGRLLVSGCTPIAYAAIITSDPGYEPIEDIWIHSGNYAVLHRIAIADGYRGRGLTAQFLDLLEKDALLNGIEVMRADTGMENKTMQHILTKHGYTIRGLVNFPWGPRLALEKRIAAT